MSYRKVVIVTGASRGLGRAVALRFGLRGWAVLVNYLNSAEKAEETAREIIEHGGDALTFKADMRNFAEVEAMVAMAVGRRGRLDVLVNNAGIGTGALIQKTADGLWDDILGTNLKGAFNAIKAASGHMRGRGGHIINIASITALKGKAGHAAYVSSKAGLIGLSKAAAIELASMGIMVNAVLPGYMLTDMGKDASEKAREEALSDNLLKTFSDPAEAAGFIYFLAGMRGVSGQVFNLDSRLL